MDGSDRGPDQSRDLSRRDFLAGAIAAGAGLGVLPELLRPGGRVAAAVRGAGVLSEPVIRRDAGDLTLAGDAIAATWNVQGGALKAVRVVDKLHGRTIALPADVFTVVLADGSTLGASRLRLEGEPRIRRLPADPRASRMAARLPGRVIIASLEDPAGRLRATWRAVMRAGSHYVRQEVELEARSADVAVRRIVLVDLSLPGAEVRGSVKGSPVVAGNVFTACEHPLSESEVEAGRARCWLGRELPLRPGAPVSVSSVIGVVPDGQLRRAFLEYVERERAHPYRTFLHYNSWYDLGYFNAYDEAGALDRIRAFGRMLHVRRGVVLDSFLFDDGWDDHHSLWHFNSGFPHGFTNVRIAAEKYGAAPGIWLSPWGGYGEPRKERLEYGKAQGFETNKDGFALSGPRYYHRFESVCLEMIEKYGVNQFKIDGTGNASQTIPGSRFDSDFDAAIHLIERLRQVEPDLYVNLTTGTYPSPFWLRYADSTWRGGDDHSFAGVGTMRQQWITYRDAATFAGVVKRGPLYPLNSLMLHGLIYARYAKGLSDDPGHDFPSEVHDYFGTGTQLQEMYITPSLLSGGDWDVIAEAARWSRRNAATLVDTHWVGGDPGALEPYGWAAWSPGKAILTLRNPGNASQRLALDVGDAFELPPGAARAYVASSPWRGGRPAGPITLRAGDTHVFELAPFEVLTLEGVPSHEHG